MPTRIVLGQGAIDRVREFIPETGNATVVTGKTFARATGLCDRLRGILGRAGVRDVSFASVSPNPSVSAVEAVARIVRESQAELVVGLGGGSAMDAAKAAAVLATNRRPLMELFPIHDFEKAPLPLVCIPTTAGTGSETTQYAILNNDQNTDKLNLNSPQMFPVVALLDPELSLTMPKDITADTGLDALSHAVEGYVSRRSQPISDCLALESIRVIRENLPAAVRDGNNVDARAAMLYAAALSGMVIAQTATTLLHAFGYYLTLRYGVPHGRANGALLGHYLKLVEGSCRDKVARIYSTFDARREGHVAFVNFAESLGVSTKLNSYGVKEKDLESFCDYVMASRSFPRTPGTIQRHDVERFLGEAIA